MKIEIAARTNAWARVQLFKIHPYLEYFDSLGLLVDSRELVKESLSTWIYEVEDSVIEEAKEKEPWVFL